jgi:hypothetical protein
VMAFVAIFAADMIGALRNAAADREAASTLKHKLLQRIEDFGPTVAVCATVF